MARPTSDFDLERVAQRAADAINRNDLDAFLAFTHPEVEFTSMIAEAEGEVFRGHDGVRRWWAGIREGFDRAEWQYFGLRGDARRAVARVRIEGTLSGVEVRQEMWQATVFRDGKAIWWAFFRTEEEAMDAAGLRETGRSAD